MKEVIGIASDHGGRELKIRLKQYLLSRGETIKDFGMPDDQSDSVDYPDYAEALARALSEGHITKGVLVCGTGIGMSITANKYPKVRAAVVWNEFTSRVAKLHNNANVLCLGGRVLQTDEAVKLLGIWLDTEFEGMRHQKRLDKISSIEDRLFHTKRG